MVPQAEFPPRLLLFTPGLARFNSSLATNGVNQIKDSTCWSVMQIKLLPPPTLPKKISLYVDVAKLSASVRRKIPVPVVMRILPQSILMIMSPAKPTNCMGCHASQTRKLYRKRSWPGLESRAGGFRDLQRLPRWPHRSATFIAGISAAFSKLAQTCGACHNQIARDVAESVHGQGMAAGHRDCSHLH